MKKIVRFIKNTVLITLVMAVTFLVTVFGLYYKLSDPSKLEELSGIVRKPTVTVGTFVMGTLEHKVSPGQEVSKGEQIAFINNPEGTDNPLNILKASIDGSVQKVLVHEGGFVSPGNLVFELTRESEGVIEVTESIYKNELIKKTANYTVITDNGLVIEVNYKAMTPIDNTGGQAIYTFVVKDQKDLTRLAQHESVYLIPNKVATYRALLKEFSQEVLN